MEDNDVLVPFKEAAKQLGVAPTTLRRFIEADRIKAIQPSRDVLIWQSEIDRFKSVPRKIGRPRKDKPPAAPPVAGAD